MSLPKILITGGSGALGWNLCRQWQETYEITATYFRNLPDDTRVQWERINLLETKALAPMIKKVKPDLVLHLAAIANTAFCEQHPALSHHINVYTTLELAKVTKELGIPMIFTSTDLVFNGNSAPYSEDDFCYPLSQYGLQKQQAEEALLEDFEQVTIARLPVLFGPTPTYTHNFYTESLKKLQAGESIKAFTDEYRATMSMQVAGEWLQRLIQYRLTSKQAALSLVHLAGKERLSRYELVQALATAMELSTEHIEPIEQQALDLVPARPPDVTLDISLAKEVLHYEPPSVKEQLAALALDDHS